jgi:hypothetical protein
LQQLRQANQVCGGGAMSDLVLLLAVFAFGAGCGGAIASLVVLLIIRRMEKSK